MTNGNAVALGDFLGTTDNQPLVVATNNQQRLYVETLPTASEWRRRLGRKMPWSGGVESRAVEPWSVVVFVAVEDRPREGQLGKGAAETFPGIGKMTAPSRVIQSASTTPKLTSQGTDWRTDTRKARRWSHLRRDETWR
jgi:hypothetical protein